MVFKGLFCHLLNLGQIFLLGDVVDADLTGEVQVILQAGY